jgi:hypothetical protein
LWNAPNTFIPSFNSGSDIPHLPYTVASHAVRPYFSYPQHSEINFPHLSTRYCHVPMQPYEHATMNQSHYFPPTNLNFPLASAPPSEYAYNSFHSLNQTNSSDLVQSSVSAPQNYKENKFFL